MMHTTPIQFDKPAKTCAIGLHRPDYRRTRRQEALHIRPGYGTEGEKSKQMSSFGELEGLLVWFDP